MGKYETSPELRGGSRHKFDASHESETECMDAASELLPLVPHAASPTRGLMGGSGSSAAKNTTATVNGHWKARSASPAHVLAGGSSTLTANKASPSPSMNEESRMLELDRLDAALISLRTGNPTTREVLICLS